jgi:hypothetical protein
MKMNPHRNAHQDDNCHNCNRSVNYDHSAVECIAELRFQRDAALAENKALLDELERARAEGWNELERLRDEADAR